MSLLWFYDTKFHDQAKLVVFTLIRKILYVSQYSFFLAKIQGSFISLLAVEKINSEEILLDCFLY